MLQIIHAYDCAFSVKKMRKLQVPSATGQDQGTEFGMHLGLVETGYEDKKIKVKVKETSTAKQVKHRTALLPSLLCKQIICAYSCSTHQTPAPLCLK